MQQVGRATGPMGRKVVAEMGDERVHLTVAALITQGNSRDNQVVRDRLTFVRDDSYSFCAGLCMAVSFFACRFNRVICLIRAESEGLQVAMSGSSLNALCTMRRS